VSSLPAIYFDGRSARGVSVVLSSTAGQLSIDGPGVRLALPLAEVRLTPRLGRTRRRMEFADGSACEFDDAEMLDDWFRAAPHRRANLLARLERHWGVVTLALVTVAVTMVASALWGLPWIAQHVALRLPESWAITIGQDALAGLDNMLGAHSEVPEARQRELQAAFAALAADTEPPARLVFRTWAQLGANALALPDGTVILTDSMVALADDDNELLSVLAHELGHVHERHALQRLLASAGILGIGHVVAGDAAGLSSLVLAGPTILAHLHHTRALEIAADRYAFALMRQHDIDPVWFARMLRKLEGELPKHSGTDESISSSWLSTHPPSEERARAAERLRWADDS